MLTTASKRPVIRQFPKLFVMAKFLVVFIAAARGENVTRCLYQPPLWCVKPSGLLWVDSPSEMSYIIPAMRVSTEIAFKEWAVVADALGHGEQILILRKGGIREIR